MGWSDLRCAVLAHGAGSDGDFLRASVGPALQEAGWRLEVVEDRSGSVDVVEAALDEAVLRHGAQVVGGVSLGAHAAARWAAAHRPTGAVDGLLLVLPAWTGAPSEVAGLSTASAEEVDRLGPEAAVAAVADGSWVGSALAASWPRYGGALAEALRRAGRSPGPEADQLRRIGIPAGVVGLQGDPFHPVAVAREWATLLPRAAIVEVGPEEPARDVTVLGRAALEALAIAEGSKR